MEKKQNFIQRLFSGRSKTTSFARLPIDLRTGLLSGITNELMKTPEIRSAINFVAEVFSTIPIYHRRTDIGGNMKYLEGDESRGIDFCLNKSPNVLQTKSTFLQTAIIQLLTNNNVALLPLLDSMSGNLISITPLKDRSWQLKQVDDKWYAEFQTTEPNRIAVEEVLLLSRFCTLQGGMTDNAITLQQSIMQAVQKRAEANAINPKIVQAYLKLKNSAVLSTEAAKAKAEKVAQEIAVGGASADGINIPFIQGDVDLQTINIQPIPIDKDLLDYATEVAYKYFGLTKKLIERDVSEFQWQLFIQTTLKPLANQFEEEFSKKLFSRTELQHRNWIEFDVFNAQVQTLNDKTGFISKVYPTALISETEARELLGYGRKAVGTGEVYKQTLNIVDENMAADYQMKMADNRMKPVLQSEPKEDAVNDKLKQIEETQNEIARSLKLLRREWNEDDHPRDDNGKFSETGGGGGSVKSDEKTSKSDKESLTKSTNSSKIQNAKERLSKLQGKPTGTYDLETGEPVSHDNGYQTSFQQTGYTYTDSGYDDKVNEVANVLGAKAEAGVFGGEPEVSFNAKTKEAAFKIAEQYNQYSIWDWAANDGLGAEITHHENWKYDESKNKIGGQNDK